MIQQQQGNRQLRIRHTPDGRSSAVAPPAGKEVTPLEQAARWVGDHPVLAVTAALIAGASLGWLIKRR